MTFCDVKRFPQPSIPILTITLCFVELGNVFVCNKGIAKQMRIVKMIEEFLTKTILRICLR